MPGYQRDSAANVGTRVHTAAEQMALGETPDVGDDIVPFVESFQRDFIEKYRPEFHRLYTEAMVYHTGQDGSVLPYGGTMDVYCRIGDLTYLIDYKTTKSGVYPETALQLAAGPLRRVHRAPRRPEAIRRAEGGPLRRGLDQARWHRAHRVRRYPARVPVLHRCADGVGLGTPPQSESEGSMKKAIGITIHYDDQSIDKVPIDVVINAAVATPAGSSNVNWLNADECPIHGPWEAIAAGVSKKTGKHYTAFWTCDIEQGSPRCSNKPSRDWVETHPTPADSRRGNLLPAAAPADSGEFDSPPVLEMAALPILALLFAAIAIYGLLVWTGVVEDE